MRIIFPFYVYNYNKIIKWEDTMEKDVIINLFDDNINLTSYEKNIVDAIRETNMEMNRAREMFELVSDPKLIDYAIYMEEAAKAKLAYLLDQARKYDIKVDNNYALKRTSVV